jgi:hypothetical protein
VAGSAGIWLGTRQAMLKDGPGGEKGGTRMRFLLLIILIILLIAALPTWPYSAGWGYYPGGILGIILIIVIVLLLLGRI